MATGKRGPIVDEIFDCGGFDGDPAPGGHWLLTEDGQRLTLDEAFPAKDDPVVPNKKKDKGPTAKIKNWVGAVLHYERHGPNPSWQDQDERVAMSAIINWAADHDLPGWKDFNVENSYQRGLLGGGMQVLKIPPGK